MKKITFLFSLGLIFMMGCGGNEKKVSAVVDSALVEDTAQVASIVGRPIVPIAEIFGQDRAFFDYYYRYVFLFDDFVALDTAGERIGKGEFLKRLSAGTFFPLAVESAGDSLSYRLEGIPKGSDAYISGFLKQEARARQVFYAMEGKPVPAFSFKGLDGRMYSSENTKGRVVLFKCWFIHCTACVKEFPSLNKLVEKYNDRQDILFISLASDSKKELDRFLAKNRFDYVTIPDQADYMTDQLKVWSYPTHFLIDKKGILVRVLPNEVEAARALKMLIKKEAQDI